MMTTSESTALPRRVQSLREIETSGAVTAEPEDTKSSGERTGEPLRVVVFRLGEEAYAFPLENVAEISRVPAITPVPGVEDFVVGLANLRGNVIAVLDIKTVFGIAEEEERPLVAQRLLCLDSDGVAAAVLVDRVEGVARVSSDELEPPLPGAAEALRPWLLGQFRRDSRLVAVLDAGIVQALRERLERAERTA